MYPDFSKHSLIHTAQWVLHPSQGNHPRELSHTHWFLQTLSHQVQFVLQGIDPGTFLSQLSRGTEPPVHFPTHSALGRNRQNCSVIYSFASTCIRICSKSQIMLWLYECILNVLSIMCVHYETCDILWLPLDRTKSNYSHSHRSPIYQLELQSCLQSHKISYMGTLWNLW